MMTSRPQDRGCRKFVDKVATTPTTDADCESENARNQDNGMQRDRVPLEAGTLMGRENRMEWKVRLG